MWSTDATPRGNFICVRRALTKRNHECVVSDLDWPTRYLDIEIAVTIVVPR